MHFQHLASLEPIYIVGDSHSLIFRFLSFEEPRYFARPFVTVPVYVSGLSASTILDAGGEVNTKILHGLNSVLEIAERERGWRRYVNERSSETSAETIRSIVENLLGAMNFDGQSIVLFVAGALDVAELLRTLGPETDFALDDPDYDEARFEGPILPLVPQLLVERMVERHLAPIGTALARLSAMGFDSLYVRNVVPPAVDDVLFYHLRNITSSLKVRTKMTMLVNRELRRLAEANGARYLDLWRVFTRDGIVDARFHLDGDHLNLLSAQLTLEALMAEVRIVRGKPLDASGRTEFFAPER